MLPGTSPVLSFFIDTYRTPPFLLPIYLAAAERYAVPWQVLAAINEVESNYGYDLGVSSAGAEGWMQFMPEEWSAYGVDANGAGVRDPYNPADAIFAAARYLQAAGAAHDLRAAIYAYNHSSSYVESVLLRARLLGKTPRSMIGGLAAIVDGRIPVESSSVNSTATPRGPRCGRLPLSAPPRFEAHRRGSEHRYRSGRTCSRRSEQPRSSASGTARSWVASSSFATATATSTPTPDLAGSSSATGSRRNHAHRLGDGAKRACDPVRRHAIGAAA